ncbi:putative Golgi reassembly stacking protein [Aspergillus clavatus NRRL 1]|uniref:Golgi reassembly stacking protein, putative n=1 Tax=Aspergillus clavatus (strain ATCC 1007 / CBS 513.65 / DSM 816 / NCTC 3887 / NRRL 1 / QM 1276 / 107) TaxID=344612 RepID=A1CTP7_ASPCL|nr:Golgi reassembly stacking protein, putative [Aspergillus clavatus NRRL 1]EAW06684.1 Golgi reassembly stacking protein, putative [Aspergillus clavatus NRRL 1]
MFGALNRFIGRLDSEPVQHPRTPTADNAFGFQVLRNKDPELPLEPWFDFIVGINGHPIEDPDPNLFATEVRNCAGTSVRFEVWSAKGQKTHTVSIQVSPSNPTLGLALQLAPLSSTQNIWHVLSIPSPLSPAYRAGLLPHSDYIIGTPSGTLRGEAALGELVEDHLNRTLVLWVYNSEFDVVREVELVPTRGWGGEGALGAELGYGALHRLPVGLGEEVEGPGEVVFETREDGTSTPVFHPLEPQPDAAAAGGSFLVPANMASPPPLSAPSRNLSASPANNRSPAPRRAGRMRHAGLSPNLAFDEYFAEGVQKSKEQDYIPSRKGTPLPPPPKAGVVSPPPVGSPGPAQES